jgi:hypothetical protein
LRGTTTDLGGSSIRGTLILPKIDVIVLHLSKLPFKKELGSKWPHKWQSRFGRSASPLATNVTWAREAAPSSLSANLKILQTRHLDMHWSELQKSPRMPRNIHICVWPRIAVAVTWG